MRVKPEIRKKTPDTEHDADPPPKRDGRKENATATQAALRAAGRQLFATLGYEATSVGALCTQAGVTTGALYHHYGDKKGLFAAVAEELECSLVERAKCAMLAAQAQGGDAWNGFLAAIDVLLAAAADAGGRRIGLVDAPAVLGAEVWQAIRERHGHGAMTGALLGLQQAGIVGPGDPTRMAWLVLGLVYSAMQTLPGKAEESATTLADAQRLIHAMLNGLRAEHGG